MQDNIGGVNWFYFFRMTFAFLLTAALGIHSYYLHAQESVKIVSARKLMYWLYSAAFLVVCAINFVLLILALSIGDYGSSTLHTGVFTLLLLLSYIALLVGARKNSYK